MQSLESCPRTHCNVPLMWRAVAFPDRSRHFFSSASDTTHQETEEGWRGWWWGVVRENVKLL